MSIDGFLTCLTLIVALYALASPVARYRLQLLGWRLWLPSLIALISVIYLELFDVSGLRCPATWCQPLVLEPPRTLEPKQLAFLVVLLWLAYVARIAQQTVVGASKIPVIAKLVDRLQVERRYGELIAIVQPYTPTIMKAARRDLWIQKLFDDVRAYGNKHSQLELINSEAEQPSGLHNWVKGKTRSGALYALKPFVNFMPITDAKERAASSILRIIYTNEKLVKYLSSERPLLALEIMLNEKLYDYDFSDRAFHYMISDLGGQLPREILLNETLDGCFYAIDADNRILHALFSDTKVAESLEVYRPVGNFPLELLEEDTGNYREKISAAKPNKDEVVFSDPTFIVIRFFDIMVRSAMRDGIEWHMWLFYMNLIVDKLTKHMTIDHPDYNVDKEFPNFAHYLIYQVFSVYRSWLDAVDCCAADSPAIRVESTEPRHDNGSIIKSTILSIGQSLGHLADSPKITDEFFTYIFEILMRDLKSIGLKHNGSVLAEALTRSIIARGSLGEKDEYGDRLKRCFGQMDFMIRYESDNFLTALNARYP